MQYTKSLQWKAATLGKYRQGVATEGTLCLSNYAYITSSCFTS